MTINEEVNTYNSIMDGKNVKDRFGKEISLNGIYKVYDGNISCKLDDWGKDISARYNKIKRIESLTSLRGLEDYEVLSDDISLILLKNDLENISIVSYFATSLKEYISFKKIDKQSYNLSEVSYMFVAGMVKMEINTAKLSYDSIASINRYFTNDNIIITKDMCENIKTMKKSLKNKKNM